MRNRSIVVALSLLFVASVRADVPAAEDPVRGLVESRLESAEPWGEAEQTKFEAIWAGPSPLLDRVVSALALQRPDIRSFLEEMKGGAWSPGDDAPLVTDPSADPFWRSNFALYVGREQVRQQALDEALLNLELLDADQVVDPSAYYFHLAVCRYYLHRKEEALVALDKLAALGDVPVRYQSLASLMRGVLEPLKKEKLDGIAHDMRDIRRRLDLGRTDKKVQEIEKDVIARLDKLIEDLEKQQQQQSQSSSSQSNQSHQAADESRIMGGKGDGKVTPRQLKNEDAWGNLPDKEREKAMQALDRDFPPHYRDAIESYFKRLATGGNE